MMGITLATMARDNLREQATVHQRMLELTARQLQAVRTRDPRGVHDALQELETAMIERQRIEARRGELVRRAARDLGVAEDDVTAELIGSHAPGPAREELQQAAEQLRDVVGRLQRVVDAQRALLNHELESFDALLRGMVSHTSTAGGPTYGKDGATGSSGAPRMKLLDLQV